MVTRNVCACVWLYTLKRHVAIPRALGRSSPLVMGVPKFQVSLCLCVSFMPGGEWSRYYLVNEQVVVCAARWENMIADEMPDGHTLVLLQASEIMRIENVL